MKKTTLLCLSIAIFLTGCGSVSGTVQKPSIQTTKNSQANSKNQFIMGGKITTDTQASITSKISAKVTEINVDVGSKVNQGDVIIKLDTQDLQAQVDQAQAAVNTAKANLTNAENSTRPEQIASAQANLDSATKNYEVTKKNYDRTKTLVDSGAEALQKLDLAEQQLAAADAAEKSAQQQLNMLTNGPTKSSIDVYQAQVNQAEAALKVAQTALSNGTITAPISGVVNAKNISVGEMTSSGVKLVTISNSNALCVDAYAPLEVIGDLKEGQEVVAKVSEIPDKEFKGKITVINSKLNDQSRNILVKINIEDSSSLLKPGMFAEIGLKK